MGSAVLNACRQVGGAVGIALLGAIVAGQSAGRQTAAAFLDGFEPALLVAASILIVGAVVAASLVRSHVERPGEIAAELG